MYIHCINCTMYITVNQTEEETNIYLVNSKKVSGKKSPYYFRKKSLRNPKHRTLFPVTFFPKFLFPGFFQKLFSRDFLTQIHYLMSPVQRCDRIQLSSFDFITSMRTENLSRHILEIQNIFVLLNSSWKKVANRLKTNNIYLSIT